MARKYFIQAIFLGMSIAMQPFVYGATTDLNSPTAKSAKLLHVSFLKTTGGVKFRATGHPSALKVNGKGSGFDGQFEVLSNSLMGKAIFDLASLQSGIEMRDKHMREKYLEVEKYPQAELLIQKMNLSPEFERIGASLSHLPFQGTLKLHGVEKPISGTMDLKREDNSLLNIDAQFSIKLTDFAILIPTFAGITIADQVDIEVSSAGTVSQCSRHSSKCINPDPETP